MKHVVRYLLDADGRIPMFIHSGGGIFAIGNEYIGVSCDDEKFHLPLSVYKLDKAALIARVTAFAPKGDDRLTPLTTQEIADLVDAYLAENGLEGYA